MTMGNCGEGCLTKKSLIDKLTAIIDIEAKKPYELMDDALVAECADFLMELEEKDKLCDAEVEQRVALIFGTDKTARVKTQQHPCADNCRLPCCVIVRCRCCCSGVRL